MTTKGKLKSKWKKIIFIIIFLIFFIVFGLSTFHIIQYKSEKNKIKNQLNIIEKKVNIIEVNDSENTEIIGEENNPEINEEDTPKPNPYWDYISMNLIDVDFKELKSINKQVKGWIQVNGTNINYPFVQYTNNKYYLTHSFDKSYNNAGWIFLDYRNDLTNFNDKNTIIYGHSRLDKTMFGSLKNILSNGWLNNTNNYVVKLSTEYENTLWQVFSIYHIDTTSDYIKTSFKDDSEFNKFTNMLLNRSEHNFNTTVSENDRILTLSTCYNRTDKLVLHAKLIKREPK